MCDVCVAGNEPFQHLSVLVRSDGTKRICLEECFAVHVRTLLAATQEGP